GHRAVRVASVVLVLKRERAVALRGARGAQIVHGALLEPEEDAGPGERRDAAHARRDRGRARGRGGYLPRGRGGFRRRRRRRGGGSARGSLSSCTSIATCSAFCSASVTSLRSTFLPFVSSSIVCLPTSTGIAVPMSAVAMGF